jgi:hypothetical protein
MQQQQLHFPLKEAMFQRVLLQVMIEWKQIPEKKE